MNKNIFVACSAKEDVNFRPTAESIGEMIAIYGNRLLTGGSADDEQSTMRDVKRGYERVARDFLDLHVKRPLSITTTKFMKEFGNSESDEIRIYDSLMDRQKDLILTADCTIALCGGLGTMGEIIDAYILNQTKEHKQTLIVFNWDGYWNHFYDLMENMYLLGKCSKPTKYIHWVESLEELEEILKEI